MSTWTELGLPAPNSGDYGFTLSPGLYRTPFPTYKPDQARQYRKTRKTFTLTIEVDRAQLKTAEEFLRSVGYREFSLPLITGEGRLVETTIRLVGPYKVAPSGYRTWAIGLVAETMAAFWTGETQVIEDAELSTVYTSGEWTLSSEIPAGSTLVVVSGQVRYQPPGSSSWTQWVGSNLVVQGGGKIQVRQTSSGIFDKTTVGEVRIAGVPWRLEITTEIVYTDEGFSLAWYATDVYSEAELTEAQHQLWNQDSKTGQAVYAKALSYARTGSTKKREEVQTACAQVMGTEIDPATGNRSSSLAIGRGLLCYVLSAELVGLDEPLLTDFKAWLATTITTNNSENRSLKRSFETQSSQWGLFSGASYIAACRFLGQTANLAAAANIFKGWLGDRTAYAGFTNMWRGDAWRPDPAAPVGINPIGSQVTWPVTGLSYDVSGCLPDAMRMWDSGPEGETGDAGEFVYPYPINSDAWTMLQGAFAIAWQLDESGYSEVWEASDNALLRAVNWMITAVGNPAAGDDEWIYHVCNRYYETSFAVSTITASPKQVGSPDYLFGASHLPFPVPDLSRLEGRIWVDPESLVTKSVTSDAWLAMKSYADIDPVLPEVWNNNDMADASALACAYVWVRTQDEDYRTKAKEICLAAIGTEIDPSTGARAASLQLGRNLLSYVVTADLIGFRDIASEQEVSDFEDWVRSICFAQNSDARSVATCNYIRPNNWGTMCGASILAAYAWLGETDKFCAGAAIHKAFLGDRDIYSGWAWRYDFTWHADPDNMRPINAKGTTLPWDNPYTTGIRVGVVDGILPEEMRRWDGVSYIWPAPQETYCWESLQGLLAQSVILNRAGYDCLEWEDRALLRACTWLHTYPTFANNYVWLPSGGQATVYMTVDSEESRGQEVSITLKTPAGNTVTETITLDESDSRTPVALEQTLLEIISVTVGFSSDGALKVENGGMECLRIEDIDGPETYTQSVGYPAKGDDIWQPVLFNLLYGTNFPVSTSRPGSFGKNIGFTLWSHV